jgi:phage recombination protein Bet
MNATTARGRAIARQDDSIQQNVAKIEEAKRRPPSALALMAARLGVSEGNLTNTLKATVFKNCSDAEFVALVIVANEHDLNPLLREIYAFPKKGGGIQAIVGYDGWIKIANRHPQYDGIEFDHIEDQNGNTKAVEGILYRKDRNHPTKKIVYLKEFKRNTEPWNTAPNHMLDVRCFCQTVRLGLGINLGVEGDDDVTAIEGEIEVRNITPQPTRAQMIDHDPETGEIIDTVTDDNPNAAEGRADIDHGDQHDGSEDDAPYAATVADLLDRIAKAGTVIDAKAVEKDWRAHMEALPDAENERIDAALNERIEHLKA